jgi:hypothetical protein
LKFAIIFLPFQKMLKQPPPQFGKFKQLEPEHYEDLQKVLLPLQPQSRHMLATLQLSMQGLVVYPIPQQ